MIQVYYLQPVSHPQLLKPVTYYSVNLLLVLLVACTRSAIIGYMWPCGTGFKVGCACLVEVLLLDHALADNAKTGLTTTWRMSHQLISMQAIVLIFSYSFRFPWSLLCIHKMCNVRARKAVGFGTVLWPIHLRSLGRSATKVSIGWGGEIRERLFPAWHKLINRVRDQEILFLLNCFYAIFVSLRNSDFIVCLLGCSAINKLISCFLVKRK